MPLIIHWHWVTAGIAAVLLLLVILYLGIENYSKSHLLRQSNSVAVHLDFELKKTAENLKGKDDELDLIFISLFQWVKLTGDYRTMLKELSQAIKSDPLNKNINSLETQYSHLLELFETDRKKHMEKIKSSEDYAEQVKIVVDEIGKVLTGMQAGIKAEETPILNENRKN
jgi:hypothetical protein